MEYYTLTAINIGIIFSVISFILGYLCGSHKVSSQQISQSQYRNKNNAPVIDNKTIGIDERKIVLDIDTSNLEKKYDSLGNVSESNQQISESVNKLQKLKR